MIRIDEFSAALEFALAFARSTPPDGRSDRVDSRGCR